MIVDCLHPGDAAAERRNLLQSVNLAKAGIQCWEAIVR